MRKVGRVLLIVAILGILLWPLVLTLPAVFGDLANGDPGLALDDTFEGLRLYYPGLKAFCAGVMGL